MTRPVRGCAECGQSDDHPRHVEGRIAIGRFAVAPTPRHLDCCAATGCPLCAASVAEHAGLTGPALIDSLAAQRAARTKV